MMKKKKTIKIDFRYYWWHFNPENNLFTNLLKKDYNVIIDKENPDYVFFSTYDGKRPIQSKTYGSLGKKIESFSPLLYNILKEIYYFRKERWKMPILKGNFVKIFFTVEDSKPDMNKCDWAFSYYYDEELKNSRHLRLPAYAFYAVKNPKELVKKKQNIKKILNKKTKFCAFICSNNIYFRNRFFKKLNKHKKVESWGKCLNNMGRRLPKLVEINKDIKSKKETKEHIERDFLGQYKFIIAFENASREGYITERKTDPMRVNTIPIYWGDPLVHRDFNTKSFINYHDFERIVKKRIPKFFFNVPFLNFLSKRYVEEKTFIKMIEKILEIDKNDELYMGILMEPWYNDNKPPKTLDRNNLRKRLKKIIENPK